MQSAHAGACFVKVHEFLNFQFPKTCIKIFLKRYSESAVTSSKTMLSLSARCKFSKMSLFLLTTLLGTQFAPQADQKGVQWRPGLSKCSQNGVQNGAKSTTADPHQTCACMSRLHVNPPLGELHFCCFFGVLKNISKNELKGLMFILSPLRIMFRFLFLLLS